MDDEPAKRRAPLAGGADRREEDGADDEVEVGARRDDRRVVAAELEQRAPEPRCDARGDLLPHRRRAGRGDERDAVVLGELHRAIGAADHELEEPVGRVAEPIGRPLEQRGRRDRRERRPLRRLPDHRIAADERERGVPAPDRDREVEGADHGDGAERMPGLRQPVARALGGDRAAVQLSREPDREVADVDHLLDLAEALLGDLPDLERDERAERLLLAAELLAEQADELAATRRRHLAPRLERGDGASDGGVGGGLVGPRDAADLLAGDRCPDDEIAVRHARGVDAEPLEKGGGGAECVERSHRTPL